MDSSNQVLGVDEGAIVHSVKPLVPTCDSLTTLEDV